MFRFVSVIALVCFGFVVPSSARPSDTEKATVVDIYRHIVEMDTFVEGGRVPEMAAYPLDGAYGCRACSSW